MLLLMLLVRQILHLMMTCHLNWLHQRCPFCDSLLAIMVVGVMGIDVLLHAVAVVVVHHNRDWLDLHDGGALLAGFSHGYGILSVCFDTVWHLVVVHIAELILLWWDISFNSRCVCAIQCIYMIQAWIVLHLIGQYGSIGWEWVKLGEVVHAVWIWVDHLIFWRRVVLLERLIWVLQIVQTAHAMLL